MLRSDLIKDYADLRIITDRVQDVFSLPSFFTIMACFMHAFILLSEIIADPAENIRSNYIIICIICIQLPSGCFALLIPACAAQVSREAKRNTISFHRLHEQMSFHPQRTASKENFSVIGIMKQTPSVKLSAWDMINFSGSTIPAVLGTLLTYGLLILNLNTSAC